MHIIDSTLAMSARHRLENEVLQQLEGAEAPTASFGTLMLERLQPVSATRTETPAATEQADAREALNKVLQSLFYALFGGSKEVPESTATEELKPPDVDTQSLRRPVSLAFMQVREEESCSFSASGNTCLADGSSRQFEVSYEMERSEEATWLDIGGPLRDPLVLDRGAPVGKLGEHEVSFDLDADGKTESMRMPTETSALIFIDRNRNGRADNGSELFGPQSGDGFADLAKLDSDGNHWIDSADAAYADLKLWSVDSEGQEHVETLAAAGIGALSTRSEATPFTIKENGQVIGQVRGSSVWLGEESGAGIVRQIDVVTRDEGSKAA